MVYETDFYTIRRPYSRPTITSYSVTRRSVPWDKVPTVPRPTQIPEPFTVYGSKSNYYSADRKPTNSARPHQRAGYRQTIISKTLFGLCKYKRCREESGQPRSISVISRPVPSQVPEDVGPFCGRNKQCHVRECQSNPTHEQSRTPRHYVVTDTPDRQRRAEQQYSYSYSSEEESRRRGTGLPTRSYSSSSETVSRSSTGGPGSYSYSTERSSRSSDYPGSYHSSYSSTTSGRLPGGTSYRHYSYRI